MKKHNIRIGTQRAMAMYDLDDVLIDASNPNVLKCPKSTVPVLVVPAEYVCKTQHKWEKVGDWMEWCSSCGCIRGYKDENWPYIQRPRILRVRKPK